MLLNQLLNQGLYSKYKRIFSDWINCGFRKQILAKEITEEGREMEKLLIDIMLKSIKTYSCIVIMCDSVYYNVFREDVFFNMDVYISYFLVSIFIKTTL